MQRSLLALLVFLTFLAGCSADAPKGTDSARSPLTVGLVFDVGGRGDKSFNDSAYHGLELAREQYGIDFLYVEPGGEGADREAALRQMAADPDVELIVGVGLLFSEDIAHSATAFPDKKFVCIDYLPAPGATIPENLSGMVFEERKGSFLAGAVAALASKSRTVGFIGGMESAIIKKFEEGFKAGVRHVDPGMEVITGYIGMTGSAFTNPAKGKELALGQYGRGADIIYQAAGASGLGVVEAARETGKLVIMTDMQENMAPGVVLTSMTKAVDRALLKTIEELLEGNFRGGETTVFGIADRYTDYVVTEEEPALLTPAIRSRVEEIRNGIISGAISIDRP